MLPLFISAIENDDDRQFVADIYTRYQPALYRKAQKVLHDNDRAEEAVHEAMLRVIRYLDRVREIPSDDLPQKEIAGLTGLTTGNVRLIISRAKKKVLAAYDERGGFDYE